MKRPFKLNNKRKSYFRKWQHSEGHLKTGCDHMHFQIAILCRLVGLCEKQTGMPRRWALPTAAFDSGLMMTSFLLCVRAKPSRCCDQPWFSIFKILISLNSRALLENGVRLHWICFFQYLVFCYWHWLNVGLKYLNLYPLIMLRKLQRSGSR